MTHFVYVRDHDDASCHTHNAMLQEGDEEEEEDDEISVVKVNENQAKHLKLFQFIQQTEGRMSCCKTNRRSIVPFGFFFLGTAKSFKIINVKSSSEQKTRKVQYMTRKNKMNLRTKNGKEQVLFFCSMLTTI